MSEGMRKIQHEAIALGKEVNELKKEIKDYEQAVKDSGKELSLNDQMILIEKYKILSPKMDRLNYIRKFL